MSKTVDNTIHLSLIKKICYCPNNDILAVLEQGAKKLKLYTTHATLTKEQFEPSFEEKAFILDFCYSERLNMVFILFIIHLIFLILIKIIIILLDWLCYNRQKSHYLGKYNHKKRSHKCKA